MFCFRLLCYGVVFFFWFLLSVFFCFWWIVKAYSCWRVLKTYVYFCLIFFWLLCGIVKNVGGCDGVGVKIVIVSLWFIFLFVAILVFIFFEKYTDIRKKKNQIT